MAEAIVTELIKSLLEKLVCAAVDEARFAAERDSHLNELAKTKAMVDAFLLDQDDAAMTLQNGTGLARRELLRLRSALDMIDDLLDETAARSQIKRGAAGFKDRVRLFFSVDFNPILCLWRDVKHVKGIREELDSLNKDHALLGSILSMLPSAVTQTSSAPKRDLGSDVISNEVIGRDSERDVIIRMLQDSPHPSSESSPFSVIAIVGFGGMGKTTLAQYVYNHEWVKNHFDILLWVYASRDFDAKEILDKILASAKREARRCDLEMNELQLHVKENIEGKKYLLVLDDIWDDNKRLHAEWDRLRTTLMHGGKGSKVLITTRDENVAATVGCIQPYKLADLNEADACRLFKLVAFRTEHKLELEDIGEQIAKGCPRIPLVIRSIAGTLRMKPEVGHWQEFLENKLHTSISRENVVMDSLKLSYNQLQPRLKLCFACCSLFPKGYEFERNELVCLWNAFECGEEREENRSSEEAGEEYVLNQLLQRGFLQNAEEDEFGCIAKFSMHDLIYDLALNISRPAYEMLDSLELIKETISHVSFTQNVQFEFHLPPSLLKHKAKLRSLLMLDSYTWFGLQLKELPKLQYLKALSLPRMKVTEIPSSIGKLIHLRYLNLSQNFFCGFPKSITQLVNLFCLNLTGCKYLEELPIDMSKLVKLKHLHLKGCDKLTHMPLGFGKLTHLELLDKYVVGESQSSGKVLVGGLDYLTHLNNLKGELIISVNSVPEGKLGSGKKTLMEEKRKLSSLCIVFKPWEISKEESEMVLDSLKPHVNLRYLFIQSYRGDKLPSWMMEFGYLYKLVRIKLEDFEGCTYLCALGKLPNLKVLHLRNMSTVEYIEQSTVDTPSQHIASHPFFPSLEELILHGMPCLKGWSTIKYHSAFPNLKRLNFKELGLEVVPGEFQGSSSLESLEIRGCQELTDIPMWIDNLTSLRKLEISYCQKLTWLPKQIGNVSNLEELEIIYCPRLREKKEAGRDEQITSSSSKLKVVNFENVGLEAVPDCFRGLSSLQSLEIRYCNEFSEFPEWIDTLASLKELVIRSCHQLTSLPKQIAHLSNLEGLVIEECPNMSWKGRNEVGSTKSEPHWMQQRQGTDKGKQTLIPPFPNLKGLLLWNVGVEVIPDEFQGISSLESLWIYGCSKLKDIPKWIGSLSYSLKRLHIQNCPQLTSLVEQMVAFPNLEELIFGQCLKVEKIWEKAINEEEEESEWDALNPYFPNLKQLCLWDLQVKVVPKEFRGISSLEDLDIRHWEQLEELPEWIHTLTSLKELLIFECPKLRRLPNQIANLSNLKELHIRDCPSLVKRCKNPEGEDWPLIQHVHDVYLNDFKQT